jgi:hypothetical protein
MLKVFSHYLPTHTLQQVLVRRSDVVCGRARCGRVARDADECGRLGSLHPVGADLRRDMIALNAAMGLYRPVYQRSHRQAFARVALSLTVSVPVAYLVFGLLPWSEIAPHSLQVSVLLLLCFLLLVARLVNQRQASALFVPRVLIVGTGRTRAWCIRT